MDNEKDLRDIDLILKGKQRGYNNILNRYKGFIFTVILKIIHNREEAEELAQDTFVKAFKSIDTFERKATFRTWLYRIAYTTTISHIRSNKKRNEVFSNVEIRDDRVGDRSYEEIDKDQHRKEYIKRAMNILQADDAAVLSFYYLREMSIKETAQVMSIEENAVKVKLYRARQRLSNILKQKEVV